MKNKGADQTARIRRLVCACAFSEPLKTGFLASRPIYGFISEPVFYGDLVYKFKRIVGKPNLSDQFKKIVKRYKRVGHIMYIVRQSASLVVNPITVDSYVFNVVLHDSGSGLRLNDSPDLTLKSIGWCLMPSLAGPTVAQLEVFFSSDYLFVSS